MGTLTPNGITEDSTGNIYVADVYSGKIFKTPPGGNTSIYAMGFKFPAGIASDGTNIFVADYGNNAIKMISPQGATGPTVTTIATAPTTTAIIVAPTQTTIATGLINPYGLYYDKASQVLYCTEYNSTGRIIQISNPTGASVVTDLGATNITFNYPSSLFLKTETSGIINIYVASTYDKCIYRSVLTTSPQIPSITAPVKIIGSSITPIVNTSSKNLGSTSSKNLGSTSSKNLGSTSTNLVTFKNPINDILSLNLYAPSSIAYDIINDIIFIADYMNDQVYSINTLNTIEVIAGTGVAGYSGDGSQGSFATLNKPICIYYSPLKGSLFISDYENRQIRYINLNAGNNILPVSLTLGYPTFPKFSTTTMPIENLVITKDEETIAQTNIITIPRVPSSITTLLSTIPIENKVTSFYISNLTNNFYYITSSNIIYTYNIQTTSTTILNISNSVSLGKIVCMTMDSNSNLYLCDSTKHCIWKITTNDIPRTSTRIINSTIYAGVPGTSGWNGDGRLPANTNLNGPTWIAFDKKDILYISDTGNFCIRCVNLGRIQTVVNASTGSTKPFENLTKTVYTIEQDAIASLLHSPAGFAFDSKNNMIFCDQGTNTIYRVTTEGRISLVCGSSSTFIDTIFNDSIQIYNNISIRAPTNIAIDKNDIMYVTGSRQIIKIEQNPITRTEVGNTVFTYKVNIFAGIGTDGIDRYISSDIYTKYASFGTLSNIQILTNNQIYTLDSVNSTSSYIRSISPNIIDIYSKGAEGALKYSPLSIIANFSKDTYNTSILAVGISEEPNAGMNKFKATAMCVDDIGNSYIANKLNNNIFKLDKYGKIEQLLSGLNSPQGICIYNNSILYISDTGNNRIVKYNLADGINQIIYTSTVNPTANAMYKMGFLFTIHPSQNIISIINIKTNSVQTISCTNLYSITVDKVGTIYVATSAGIIYYKMNYIKDSVTGSITVTAPLTYVLIDSSVGVCYGLAYNEKSDILYYSSQTARLVWKIPVINIMNLDINYRVIVAGYPNVAKDVPTDGSYANTTTLYQPQGIYVDSNENLYILDNKLDTFTSLIQVASLMFLQKDLSYIIAGGAQKRIFGDGNIKYQTNLQAIIGKFGKIESTCTGSDGSIYISDSENHCVWKIDYDGMLSPFAGTGASGYATDAANTALGSQLNTPKGITVSKSGNVYICDSGNNRILRVTEGKLYILAGYTTSLKNLAVIQSNSTNPRYDITAIQSYLLKPLDVAVDKYENVFVSDTGNNHIVKITPLGILSIYVGGGTALISNTVNATAVRLDDPRQLAFNMFNELYFINKGTNQVLKVLLNGKIEVVAGISTTSTISSSTGDGGPATSATLNAPVGLAINNINEIYISDSQSHIIRKIDTAGIIRTVVGDGTVETQNPYTVPNIDGNGENPLQITLEQPGYLACDGNNRLVITQLTKPKVTLIPFTDTDSCGLTGRYIRIESQGQKIKLMAIKLYDKTGTEIVDTTMSITSSSSSPDSIALRNLITFGNTTLFESATGGLNEYIQIDLQQDTAISYIILTSAGGSTSTNSSTSTNPSIVGPSESIGMKLLYLNSSRTIIYTKITTPDITTVDGDYTIFRSQYSNIKCTIDNKLPTSYISKACGVSKVQYIRIKGNSVNRIELSQIVILDQDGTNWCSRLNENSFTIIPSSTTTSIKPNFMSLIDGLYLSKKLTYLATSPNEMLRINLGTSATDIIFIIVYLASSNKTNMNGASIELLNSSEEVITSRKFKNITNSYSLQYVTLDFRQKSIFTPCAANVLNLVKYKNKEDSLIRYVQINISELYVSNIVIRSKETGEDYALGKSVKYIISDVNTKTDPNIEPTTTLNNLAKLTDGSYMRKTMSNSVYGVPGTWIEVDLLQEYLIGDITVYTAFDSIGIASTHEINIRALDKTLTPVKLPLTNQQSTRTKYIRIQGVNNLNIAKIEAYSPGTITDSTNYNNPVVSYLTGSSCSVSSSSDIYLQNIISYQTPWDSSYKYDKGSVVYNEGSYYYKLTGISTTSIIPTFTVPIPRDDSINWLRFKNNNICSWNYQKEYDYNGEVVRYAPTGLLYIKLPSTNSRTTTNQKPSTDTNSWGLIPTTKFSSDTDFITISLNNTANIYYFKLTYLAYAPTNKNPQIIQYNEDMIEISRNNLYRSIKNDNDNDTILQFETVIPNTVTETYSHTSKSLVQTNNIQYKSSLVWSGSTKLGDIVKYNNILYILADTKDPYYNSIPFRTTSYYPLYTIPQTYNFSLESQIGTPRVRYVKYLANSTSNKPLQCSQIIVIDKHGINVAYNKIVTANSILSTNNSTTSSNAIGANMIINGTDSVSISPYKSIGSAFNEYVQIDLLGEYEVVLIKYWNASTNLENSNGTSISLLDSFEVQIVNKPLAGNKASEILDFRKNSLSTLTPSIVYPISVLKDPFLTGVYRARYIRLENPGLLLGNTTAVAGGGNEPTLMISQLAVYDIFGRNVAIGKPTRCNNMLSSSSSSTSSIVSQTNTSSPVNNYIYTTTNSNTFQSYANSFVGTKIPGDWWEVDLGDEYSIVNIDYYHADITNASATSTPTLQTMKDSITNLPIVLYGRNREEYLRTFINPASYTTNTMLSIPMLNTVSMLSVIPARIGSQIRFIRITTTSTTPICIRQLVVIDYTGANVAVGKATRTARSDITFISTAYGPVNGRFDSPYTGPPTKDNWWELDLGRDYFIYSIIYYNTITTPTPTITMNLTAYNSLKAPVNPTTGSNPISLSGLKQTIIYSSATAPVLNLQGLGKKARYVRFDKGSVMSLSQIAVIDCLGRNVALGKNIYSSFNTNIGSSTSITNLISGNLTATTNFIKLGLIPNVTYTIQIPFLRNNIPNNNDIALFSILNPKALTNLSCTLVGSTYRFTNVLLIPNEITINLNANVYTNRYNNKSHTIFYEIKEKYNSSEDVIENWPSTDGSLSISQSKTILLGPSDYFTVTMNRTARPGYTYPTQENPINFEPDNSTDDRLFTITRYTNAQVYKNTLTTTGAIGRSLLLDANGTFTNTSPYILTLTVGVPITNKIVKKQITVNVTNPAISTNPIEYPGYTKSSFSGYDLIPRDIYPVIVYPLGSFNIQMQRDMSLPSGSYSSSFNMNKNITGIPSVSNASDSITYTAPSTPIRHVFNYFINGTNGIQSNPNNEFIFDVTIKIPEIGFRTNYSGLKVPENTNYNFITDFSVGISFNGKITPILTASKTTHPWDPTRGPDSITKSLTSYNFSQWMGSSQFYTKYIGIGAGREIKDGDITYWRSHWQENKTNVTFTLNPGDSFNIVYSYRAVSYYNNNNWLTTPITVTPQSNDGLIKNVRTYNRYKPSERPDLPSYLFEAPQVGLYADFQIDYKATSYIETNKIVKISEDFTRRQCIETASLTVQNTTPNSFVEVDLGEEYYVKNVTAYSVPRMNPVARYIRYCNNQISSLDTRLQCSQLIVKDITDTNVALNKPFTCLTYYTGIDPTTTGIITTTTAPARSSTTTVDNTVNITDGIRSTRDLPKCYVSTGPKMDMSSFTVDEYLEIDLGQEYDIKSIEYWNRSTLKENSKYTGIDLQRIGSGLGMINTRQNVFSANLKGSLDSENFILPVTYGFFTQYTSGRYIRYSYRWNLIPAQNLVNETVPPLQCSQLIVIDKNNVNVALNRPITYRSINTGSTPPPITIPPTTIPPTTTGASTSTRDIINVIKITNGEKVAKDWPPCYVSNGTGVNEYVEIDLGDEYQLSSIQYWNRTVNKTRSNGTFIQLIRANRSIVKSVSLTGNLESEEFSFTNNVIDETIQTFNTDLEGTTLTLKDAHGTPSSIGYLYGPSILNGQLPGIPIVATQIKTGGVLVYLAYEEPYTKMVDADGNNGNFIGPPSSFNQALWSTYDLNSKTAYLKNLIGTAPPARFSDTACKANIPAPTEYTASYAETIEFN